MLKEFFITAGLCEGKKPQSPISGSTGGKAYWMKVYEGWGGVTRCPSRRHQLLELVNAMENIMCSMGWDMNPIASGGGGRCSTIQKEMKANCQTLVKMWARRMFKLSENVGEVELHHPTLRNEQVQHQ